MSNQVKKKGIGSAIYDFADRKWDKIDFVLMIIIFAVCYFCFVQGDLLVTGNRSFLMQSHPLAFYDKCLEWTGDLGANYLPSTFVLFAIWNLPLRLLGMVPATLLTNSLGNILWYKLLPMLFLVASAFLMEKICLEMKMGRTKSRIARYIFLISPLVLFCQVIFGQYDIFTIFFMLLGYLSFLKNDRKKFILFFAIAITFKYQAVLFFIVLLVLREKRILRILLDTILVAIPTAVEILIYYPSSAFKASVLNFGALGYVNNGVDLGGFRPLNLFLLLVVILVVLAYIRKPEDTGEEIRWSVFLLNGISFAFFGFVYFHPQWLLLCVPFMVLAVMRSRHSKILLLIQNILIVAFYMIIVQSWPVNTDQQMFAYGVLKSQVPSAWAMKMADILKYNNQIYLFTVIFAVLLVYVWLSHPKYAQKSVDILEKDTMVNARIAFIVAFLAWCIPAFLCLKYAMDGHFQMQDDAVGEQITPIGLTEDKEVRQEFLCTSDEITSLQMYFGNYGHNNEVNLEMVILDADGKDPVFRKEIPMQSVTADGWVELLEETVGLEKDEVYYLQIEGSEDEQHSVAVFENAGTVEGESLYIDGVQQDGSLILKIVGRNG